jgi:hypothetical protein
MNSNVMKLRKDNQAMQEADYNYKINLNNGDVGSHAGNGNPLLASVNT